MTRSVLSVIGGGLQALAQFRSQSVYGAFKIPGIGVIHLKAFPAFGPAECVEHLPYLFGLSHPAYQSGGLVEQAAGIWESAVKVAALPYQHQLARRRATVGVFTVCRRLRD